MRKNGNATPAHLRRSGSKARIILVTAGLLPCGLAGHTALNAQCVLSRFSAISEKMRPSPASAWCRAGAFLFLQSLAQLRPQRRPLHTGSKCQPVEKAGAIASCPGNFAPRKRASSTGGRECECLVKRGHDGHEDFGAGRIVPHSALTISSCYLCFCKR